MPAQIEVPPYERVRSLLESIGGGMTYRPGGGPGGTWELTLRGRTHSVPVRDRHINELDRLYASKVERPETWDDYDPDAPLVDDAFWQLVALFRH